MKLTPEQYQRAVDSVNNRKVIEGERDDLMMIQPVKHAWAREIWLRALENSWFPNEVDLSEDAKQFPTLLDSEREVYTDALAFLSNLDGIQVNNLTKNIGRYITSPEVDMVIVRQCFEEALHVESYSQMIETMPGLDPVEVYNRFQVDPVLASKNEYIMRSSFVMREQGYSPEAFLRAVIANIALEGIYFYSGFLVFYNFAKMGKMKESAKMIRFIQRDEQHHLDIFVNMYAALKQEMPHLFDDAFYADAKAILQGATELEIAWGKHIIRHGIMGLTDGIVDGFVRHLCDRRSEVLGLGKLYDATNPVPWFDEFSAVSNKEEGYFEAKVSAYENGALAWE